MDDLAAAAWAQHRGAPNVLRLTDQVDRTPVQTNGKFVNALGAVRPVARKPRPEPVPESGNPSHEERPGSVSSGMSNSGDVSPRPTCPASDPSRSTSAS